MAVKLDDSWAEQNLGAKNSKIKNNYFDGLEVTGPYKMVFFIIMFAYFFEQMDNWNFAFIAPSLMAENPDCVRVARLSPRQIALVLIIPAQDQAADLVEGNALHETRC